ncbi:hypothetical protein L2E82_13300 [Cichorium intybus]|uniref:Uncharacterized protein n=1 Tax=Cichorium intybus TaxID=13427 RepID=A0ACB9EX50_CICIN|nr:hypothetical protein L2E82_13300 [Cichorium intybus]
MRPPNMAAIAASLQTSLQNCSLDHHHSNAALELNSNTSLPYHWEQCLDLKTGEVYYINWRTGMKVKEDPRTANNGFYSDDEDEDEDEESSYEEEGSSSESSSAVSSSKTEEGQIGGNVLVVAGCKSCFMYFMVPKQVEECPKCNGQLLHFNQSVDNA